MIVESDDGSRRPEITGVKANRAGKVVGLQSGYAGPAISDL